MPIHMNKVPNAKGYYYYQWGQHGKKYVFYEHDLNSQHRAYQKAIKQAEAAYSHGYKH